MRLITKRSDEILWCKRLPLLHLMATSHTDRSGWRARQRARGTVLQQRH